MSIESFFHTYRAGPEFAREVSFPSPNGEVKSPIRFMSDILVKEGHEGLKACGFPFSNAIVVQDLIEIEKSQGPYLENASAIYLGVGIRAIESILKMAEFDSYEFNALLMLHFSGTHVRPVLTPNSVVEKIDPEKMRDMIKVASSDKTFASFFRKDNSALPQTLIDFYNHNDALIASPIAANIRATILPRYQDRTFNLVEANQRRAA